MNYDSLIDSKANYESIKGWVNSDRLPPEAILAEALLDIDTRLRVREMKSLFPTTIPDQAIQLQLPNDFQAPLSFRRYGSVAGRIDILDTDYFETRVVVDDSGALTLGTPTECQIIGYPATAHFNYRANGAIPVRLAYWAKVPKLAPNTQTNFLTERYPTLLRFACTWRAYDFLKDAEKADGHMKKYFDEVQAANREYDMGEAANRFEPYSDKP